MSIAHRQLQALQCFLFKNFMNIFHEVLCLPFSLFSFQSFWLVFFCACTCNSISPLSFVLIKQLMWVIRTSSLPWSRVKELVLCSNSTKACLEADVFVEKLRRNRKSRLTLSATGMDVYGSRGANEGNQSEGVFILFQRVIWDMRHLLASAA